MGASWAIYSEVVDKYKEETGLEVTWEITPIDVISAKMIATEGQGWEMSHGTLSQTRLAVESPYVQFVPYEKIPRWNLDVVRDGFGVLVEPQNYLDEPFPEMLAHCLWPDADPHKTWAWDLSDTNHLQGPNVNKVFRSVPNIINWDTVGYNPEFLPYEENGPVKTMEYGELFNPEYKGRAALQNTPDITLLHVANYLWRTGQFTPKGAVNDPAEDEIEFLVDWVTPHAKSGQIRHFWTDYGQAVNILSTREVWMSDCWQPVVMDTRRAMTPCYYAFLKHGSLFWYSGDVMSAETDLVDATLHFFNWRLEPWWTAFISRNGYSVPTYMFDDAREFMGDEFHDWHYKGQGTYLPMDEVIKITWPENSDIWDWEDRLQRGMFLPDRYFWGPEGTPYGRTGSPHPQGQIRDHGSVEDRNKNIGFLQWWPTYTDKFVEEWTKMKAESKI